MRRILQPFIVLACVLAVVSSSTLREYAKPIRFFQREQRATSYRYVDVINFRYAEDSKKIFINDMYSTIPGQPSSNIYVFQQYNNTFIQTNKILLNQTFNSLRGWSVSKNAEKIIWRLNDESLVLTDSYYVPLSNLFFSFGYNYDTFFRYSSDGKVILLRPQYYITNQIPTFIFSLQNNSIQQISFQNNTQAVVIATMNKKNGFIAIYQQPIEANDTRNYAIKQFNFNINNGLFEQNITLNSLVKKFDFPDNINLRIGQNDDFMLLSSGSQVIILKKENGHWVTKSRDINIAPFSQRLYISQNGYFILIKNQNGYHSVYKISQDLNNYEKIAFLDTPIEPYNHLYITNDGSIFIWNYNDLYYLRLLPSSSSSSTNSASESKNIANASTIIQINTPPSTQTDNSIFILGSIVILIILTIVIICLMFKHLQSMKLKQENLTNKIMQQSSLIMGSSNRHEKKQQTIEIEVFQV